MLEGFNNTIGIYYPFKKKKNVYNNKLSAQKEDNTQTHNDKQTYTLLSTKKKPPPC